MIQAQISTTVPSRLSGVSTPEVQPQDLKRTSREALQLEMLRDALTLIEAGPPRWLAETDLGAICERYARLRPRAAKLLREIEGNQRIANVSLLREYVEIATPLDLDERRIHGLVTWSSRPHLGPSECEANMCDHHLGAEGAKLSLSKFQRLAAPHPPSVLKALGRYMAAGIGVDERISPGHWLRHTVLELQARHRKLASHLQLIFRGAAKEYRRLAAYDHGEGARNALQQIDRINDILRAPMHLRDQLRMLWSFVSRPEQRVIAAIEPLVWSLLSLQDRVKFLEPQLKSFELELCRDSSVSSCEESSFANSLLLATRTLCWMRTTQPWVARDTEFAAEFVELSQMVAHCNRELPAMLAHLNDPIVWGIYAVALRQLVPWSSLKRDQVSQLASAGANESTRDPSVIQKHFELTREILRWAGIHMRASAWRSAWGIN